MTIGDNWLIPDWPAPAGIRAASTTRLGGVSVGPWASLNLGRHVGDDPQAVVTNRQILKQALDLPAEPYWLNQVHGCRVTEVGDADTTADGSWSRRSSAVCVVMTADCLPILLAHRQAQGVAAIHAGWRGLAAGVIEQGVQAVGLPSSELMAWIGPAIGPQAFQVGDEVRAAFVDSDARAATAFRADGPGRWLADMISLARQRLQRCGVDAIYGGHWCTWREPDRFFSYRRDGHCGRLASLIWIEADRD